MGLNPKSCLCSFSSRDALSSPCRNNFPFTFPFLLLLLCQISCCLAFFTFSAYKTPWDPLFSICPQVISKSLHATGDPLPDTAVFPKDPAAHISPPLSTSDDLLRCLHPLNPVSHCFSHPEAIASLPTEVFLVGSSIPPLPVFTHSFPMIKGLSYHFFQK